MTKFFISLILLSLFSSFVYSQDSIPKIYNPDADAIADINNAIAKAKSENKHVLIQVGGNWCKWCIRLHHFIEAHPALDSTIRADYVLIRVNYSKENKNPEAMKRLEYPQRFGFPVLVVLDGNGKRLHTQNTWYLEEEGTFYSEDKIKAFLKNWTVKAVSEDTYR